MAFECIDCGQATLSVIASIELPPDNRSDEITLQLLKCSSCGFSGLAVYEESRRGNLSDECWNHDGYRIPSEDYQKCLALIQSCPNPQNMECNCPAHVAINKRDHFDQWIGLNLFTIQDHFLLRYITS